MDTYQICIQARFDTYQIPFLMYRKYRERPLKRAPNTAWRLTHVRERKLRVPQSLSIIPNFIHLEFGIEGFKSPNIRGGGVNFEFSGTLNFAPFYPKDPVILKNTMVIVIHYSVVANTTTVAKHCGRVSETPCFFLGGRGKFTTGNLHK